MSQDIGGELVALLPRLRRFACGLTRSIDEADDLVQAGVERALERCDRFQAGTRLDSWMYRIIQNVWIDRMRTARRRGSSVSAEELDELPSRDGPGHSEARLMLGRIQVLLDELPDDQRLVLMLVCVEGLTYAEAASVLDIPAGTVMSRLARGRRRLHELLESGGAPECPQSSSSAAG